MAIKTPIAGADINKAASIHLLLRIIALKAESQSINSHVLTGVNPFTVKPV